MKTTCPACGTVVVLLPVVAGLFLTIGAMTVLLEGKARGPVSIVSLAATAALVALSNKGYPLVRTALDVGRTYRRK